MGVVVVRTRRARLTTIDRPHKGGSRGNRKSSGGAGSSIGGSIVGGNDLRAAAGRRGTAGRLDRRAARSGVAAGRSAAGRRAAGRCGSGRSMGSGGRLGRGRQVDRKRRFDRRQRRRHAGDRGRGSGRNGRVGCGTRDRRRHLAGTRALDGVPAFPSAGAAGAPSDGVDPVWTGSAEAASRAGSCGTSMPTRSRMSDDGVLHRSREGRRQPRALRSWRRQPPSWPPRAAHGEVVVARVPDVECGGRSVITAARSGSSRNNAARSPRGSGAGSRPYVSRTSPMKACTGASGSSSAKVADGSKTRSKSVVIVADFRDGVGARRCRDVAGP